MSKPRAVNAIDMISSEKRAYERHRNRVSKYNLCKLEEFHSKLLLTIEFIIVYRSKQLHQQLI